MAGLEEKILDGPRVHYCEESSDDETEDGRYDCAGSEKAHIISGCSINTGPKGVIQDFKTNITSKNRSCSQQQGSIDEEFERLMADDSILEEFKQRMISEKESSSNKIFGFVEIVKTGDDLLKHIDNENKHVLVIVHVYRKFSNTCSRLNECLEELAKQYISIKFLCIDAAVVGLSQNFVLNGVPALLVYKAGNLVKSLVTLESILDKDFSFEEVKQLFVNLIEERVATEDAASASTD